MARSKSSSGTSPSDQCNATITTIIYVTWTKAAAIALPVLVNPDLTFDADVA